MHQSSYDEMEVFAKSLPNDKKLLVCDVGSCDVEGDGSFSYKKLFENHYYVGLDLAPGINVDVVSDNQYKYPYLDNSFDIVISGQVIEHVEDIYLWIIEIARILKPGGLTCIIGPTSWVEHRHPVDCWRILPDGMRFLLGTIAKLNVVDIRKSRDNQDCIGIAKKGE